MHAVFRVSLHSPAAIRQARAIERHMIAQAAEAANLFEDASKTPSAGRGRKKRLHLSLRRCSQYSNGCSSGAGK
jgi:hypothetical protein